MRKKIAVFLVICVMTVSVVGCGSDGGRRQQTEQAVQTGQAVQSETAAGSANQENHDEKEAEAENKVSKGKAYRLERADNDRVTVELLYRNGSDTVAQISGELLVPLEPLTYGAMVEDAEAFAQKVADLNLPDEIMHFEFEEVTLKTDYARCDFVFSELDAENAGSVEMIAEFLGLPATNGTFSLSECDAYLQNSGVTLESEW